MDLFLNCVVNSIVNVSEDGPNDGTSNWMSEEIGDW